MNKLEKCPWCSAKPVVRQTWTGHWEVLCGNHERFVTAEQLNDPDYRSGHYCPVQPSTVHYKTEAEAIAAWNTRPDHIGETTEMIRLTREEKELLAEILDKAYAEALDGQVDENISYYRNQAKLIASISAQLTQPQQAEAEND